MPTVWVSGTLHRPLDVKGAREYRRVTSEAATYPNGNPAARRRASLVMANLELGRPPWSEAGMKIGDDRYILEPKRLRGWLDTKS
jgi:hypothetical protein